MSKPLRRHLRTIAFCLPAAIAAACLLRAPSPTPGANAPAAQPAPSIIATLQQQRLTTLRDASNLAARLLDQSAGSASDLNRLNEMLVQAELEYASSPQARLAALEDALTTAKKAEDQAAARLKVGAGNVLALLEVKAYRLGIEVKLSQESTQSK